MTTRIAPFTEVLTAVERDATSRTVAAERLAGVGANLLADLTEVRGAPGFDMVCAFEVLEHFEDDVAALREWASLLRRGGHVLVSVPAWQRFFGPADEAAGHYRRYAPDELRSRFAEAGLHPEWVRLYGWPVGRALEWAKGRIVSRRTDGSSSTAERTAQSGRFLQPTNRWSGALRAAAAAPVRVTQRLAPGRGTGLVALARWNG